uniref:Uncharacterized protein n=1 Tax=Euplotes crassus TaxID=5936 RepID=A0A7S3KTC3_EUPCR|mmetsp:Transcript_7530/g.7074  ORF Transcript_7530/g.7074 Transcript_7530/m.7074 type:complete len:262 (+) Transcript_7530:43-828(+)
MNCNNDFQREDYIESAYHSENGSAKESTQSLICFQEGLNQEVIEKPLSEEITRISQRELVKFIKHKIERCKVTLSRFSSGLSIIESRHQEEKSNDSENSQLGVEEIKEMDKSDHEEGPHGQPGSVTRKLDFDEKDAISEEFLEEVKETNENEPRVMEEKTEDHNLAWNESVEDICGKVDNHLKENEPKTHCLISKEETKDDDTVKSTEDSETNHEASKKYNDYQSIEDRRLSLCQEIKGLVAMIIIMMLGIQIFFMHVNIY